MREEGIRWEILIRSNAGGRDRAVDLNSLACVKGRSIDDSNLLECGRERLIDDSHSLECAKKRSRGRFGYARMREGEIDWEIRIHSNGKLVIASEDSNSLACGRKRSLGRF